MTDPSPPSPKDSPEMNTLSSQPSDHHGLTPLERELDSASGGRLPAHVADATATETQHSAGALDPDAGPWLIRSHYWGSWHRRGSDGGASGYTNDILRAGVFGIDLARHYNDWPDGRDEAVPASRAISEMETRLGEMTAERDHFAGVVQHVRDALIAKAGRS